MKTQWLCLALLVGLVLISRVPADEATAAAALKKLVVRIQRDERQPNKPVIAIYLGGRKITDADLKNLASFPQLQSLSFYQTKISDTDLKLLGDLKQLQQLGLTGIGLTEAGLKNLAALEHLKTLNLYGTKITGPGFKNLAALKHLQRLYLSGTNVTDADLKDLAAMEQLQSLVLSWTGVTDAGMKNLAALKQLQYVDLGWTAVTDAGLRDLTSNKKLSAIHLEGTEISDAGMRFLASSTQLQNLVLSRTEVTDAGLKHLSSLEELRVLELGWTGTTDAGLKNLLKLKKLWNLNLTETAVTKAALKDLASFPQLVKLDLAGTRVGDRDVAALAGLGKLRELNLKGTQVTEAGIKALKAALPKCQVDSLKPVAARSRRYPEGKHGKGELKYINGVPVLAVAGTPEEMGEQVGVLALKHVAQYKEPMQAVLKNQAGQLGLAALKFLAKGIIQKYPQEYRQEIDAMARVGGVERDLLILANTGGDVEGFRRQQLGRWTGCSDLLVEPAGSTTGGTLFRRNTDTEPFGGVTDILLVVVYRPEGKQPFATVTGPGVFLGLCGMNKAGLVIGSNSTIGAADQSPWFEAKGLPYMVAQRRLMEECRTLAEGEKLLRACPMMIPGILGMTDRHDAAVFEVTPKTIAVRRPSQHIVCCTNHFLSDGLKVDSFCERLPMLERARRQGKLSVADVARRMHLANQGSWTLFTVVFEPERQVLHVAFGDSQKSATSYPLKEIALGPLW